MIGRLQGTLLYKQPPALVIDVRGVGYELEAPMTTFYDLPEVGREASLYTHLVVRDDAQLLYGFSRAAERELFRRLLKVTGIGPRAALAILSGLTAEAFAACIRAEDIDRLTRVPGVGRKTAQRLMVEMRDRLAQEPVIEPVGAAAPPLGPRDEAVGALVALGYRPQEASRAVQAVGDAGLSSEELIRRALQRISGLG